MNKPPNMSRKQFLQAKEIVHDWLHTTNVQLIVSDHEVFGATVHRHDEGYDRVSIGVSAGDCPGTFVVITTTNSQDCDGRYFSGGEYVVAKATKRKRYYMSRNWKTNRPQGKFRVKTRWKIISKDEHQRDYSAEAFGY